MNATLFEIVKLKSSKSFLPILMIAMTLRGLFHYIFMDGKLTWVIFDMYYLIILHVLSFFFSEKMAFLFFKASPRKPKKYYRSFAKYWLFIFPMVPIVSYLTNSPFIADHSFLSAIPSFSNSNNYLPAGMVFAIPLILFFQTKHHHIKLEIPYWKAAVLALLSNLLIYVLLYQWLFQLYFYLCTIISSLSALSVYILIIMIGLTPILYILYQRNVLPKKLFKINLLLIYLFSFILLYKAWNYLV